MYYATFTVLYCRKNHIIPSFFILLLLYPLLLTVLLQGWQRYIKIRAEHRLERQLLQTIVLPAAEVTWEERGKEVIVQGKLFDVKEWHRTGSKIVLTGLFDEEETQIMAMLQKEADRSKSNASVIQILLLLQCFIAIAVNWFSPVLFRKALAISSSFYAFYPHPFFAVLSPPPR